MTNIVVLDTETTGLSEKEHKVIEIAAILYNIEHKAMLQCASTLITCYENPVENINGISPAVTQLDYSLTPALVMIESMADNAVALVAHNAQFDQKFVKAMNGFTTEFYHKLWICSKRDIKWHIPLPRMRLQDICEGCQIPYSNAHRAMQDVRLLTACLAKLPNLQEQIDTLTKK